MKMEMNNFRALTFCTQTPVNPLRQIIFPLRGTAVKKNKKKHEIFKKPILSKLRSCSFRFPPSLWRQDRTVFTSDQLGRPFRSQYVLRFESWETTCYFYATAERTVSEHNAGIVFTALKHLDLWICKSRSKVLNGFWVWSVNFFHLTFHSIKWFHQSDRIQFSLTFIMFTCGWYHAN